MKCSLGISNFLQEISSLPVLLFSFISLYWSQWKAFLSLLAILWNSAFKWVYLSFSPLSFSFFPFSVICKASSDNHFEGGKHNIIKTFIPFLSFLIRYMFLSVLSLHCCPQAFFSCSKERHSCCSVWWLSLLRSTGSRRSGFSGCSSEAQQSWCTDLVALWHVGSSQPRGWIHVPCIDRQILNHWTTREVLS